MDCWICGAAATTGEHKTKQSDLRAVLGQPTQTRPFYFHDKNVRNRPIGSYKGVFLKSQGRLCAPCNNQRTQPHDHAWERMSECLRARKPPFKSGDLVRADRVYPQNATQEMCNVHLYFTKLMGCHLTEAGMNFERATLAKSILSGQPNPLIYLKFGVSRTGSSLGMTDLQVDTLKTDNSVAFAAFAYSLKTLVIHVMYAIANERREGLVGAWHPRLGSNRFVIADFP